jgi:thiamine kinase-like enzyme
VHAARMYYGRLVETIDMVPSAFSKYGLVYKQVFKGVPRCRLSEREVVLHGDFWTGNLLLSPSTSNEPTVIDWEMSCIGPRWHDVGQMAAELYLLVLVTSRHKRRGTGIESIFE